MRFFASLAYQRAPDVVELARVAEDLGYDGIAVADRAALPADRRTPYPYRGDGSTPFALDSPYPDPLVLLAAVASRTERLLLMTRTLILPVRNPVLLAKAAATCQVLSGGRLILGVGTGWMEEEFAWTQTPFAGRGRRADESIDVLRHLWGGGTVEHHGEHFDLGPMVVDTVPESPIPVFIGGDSDRALRRAAERGDGYVTVPHRRATLRSLLYRLRCMRTDLGGRTIEVDVACTDIHTADDVAALEAMGASSLTVTPWQRAGHAGGDQRARVRSMEAFASTFIGG